MRTLLRTIIVITIFFQVNFATAQKLEVMQPGEKITYGAYYNWHFIWIRSGVINFNFTTRDTKLGERWFLQADAHTFKTYDLLYKIRDTVKSVCMPQTFEPEYYEQYFTHGNERSVYLYRVPPPKQKIYTEVTRFKKPFFKDVLTMQPGTRDMLATAYSFRSIDFSKLEPGRKVSFKMLVDNEIHNIFYRYLGKETITNRNKVSFDCHKISVLLLEGDFFPGGEYLKVWIDDSPNHFPVMLETKILVGSVKAIIETAEVNGKPIKFEF